MGMAGNGHSDKGPTRWGVVVEAPTYGLTVFRALRQNDPRIHTKGERVLSIEVIVHNTKE
jgi:hypothetical protein